MNKYPLWGCSQTHYLHLHQIYEEHKTLIIHVKSNPYKKFLAPCVKSNSFDILQYHRVMFLLYFIDCAITVVPFPPPFTPLYSPLPCIPPPPVHVHRLYI